MVQKVVFRAVVFDMDGVVIDTRTPIEEFWYHHAARHHIRISPEVMEGKVHGCPARQTVAQVFGHISEAEQAELLEACEVFENGMQYVAMRGVQALLGSLKAAGVATALVTSSLLPKVRKVQKVLELEGAFDAIVTSDLVPRGKPDPACYRLAAERLGLPPEECIAFEDAYSGVRAEAGAGMFTVGVGPARQETLLKEAGAKLLVPHFGDVSLRNPPDGTSSIVLNERLALPLAAE
ncbi:MAG: HAD family phosphatase [Cytophagales bacterium]|nr:HAD family phosphatase [Cytophagales bacterium]